MNNHQIELSKFINHDYDYGKEKVLRIPLKKLGFDFNLTKKNKYDVLVKLGLNLNTLAWANYHIHLSNISFCTDSDNLDNILIQYRV